MLEYWLLTTHKCITFTLLLWPASQFCSICSMSVYQCGTIPLPSEVNSDILMAFEAQLKAFIIQQYSVSVYLIYQVLEVLCENTQCDSSHIIPSTIVTCYFGVEMKGCTLGKQKDFAFRIPFRARNPVTNSTPFCFPFNSLAFLLYILNVIFVCFGKVVGSSKQGAQGIWIVCQLSHCFACNYEQVQFFTQ